MSIDMDSESRSRPNPELIWTEYRNLHVNPHSSFPKPSGHTYAPSPISSNGLSNPLPRPMQPPLEDFVQLGNGRRRSAHDAALLQRLDGLHRIDSVQPRSNSLGLLLTPISEQAARLDQMTMTSPEWTRATRRPMQSKMRDDQLPPRPEPLQTPLCDGWDRLRRQSLPATPLSAQLLSGSPGCFGSRRRILLRDELAKRRRYHYGNAKEADCFVAAVALRPPDRFNHNGQAAAGDAKVSVRVRIRPRDTNRKPFLLQRTFDLDQLRSTIPETPERTQQARAGEQSEESHSPSSQHLPPTPSTSSHDNSHGRSMNRGPDAVPIYLWYARRHLPVLAALIVSGHVQQGDVVHLPLPRPEAWSATVAHLYNGQGELSEAMKQNVVYLAGRA